MKHFEGRVAVVTGGASGIGRALAERFAKEGMKVVLADIEATPLKAAEKEMRAAGHDVLGVRTDVSKAASVEKLAEKTIERFGAVHVVCNNAGVSPPGRYMPIWEAPIDDWKWAFDVNMWGVVHGMRAFMPLLLRNPEGHMVNTASVAGLVSGSGTPVYGAAKHAVVRITEAIYSGLRDRKSPIGVSLLCPGVVATQIYNSERNRPGRPQASGAAPDAYHQTALRLYQTARTAPQVAEQVFQAIVDNQFYVVTTQAFDPAIKLRMEDILARRNPDFPDLMEMSERDVGLR